MQFDGLLPMPAAAVACLMALLMVMRIFLRPQAPSRHALALQEEHGFRAADVSCASSLTATLYQEAASGRCGALPLLAAAGADVNVQHGEDFATPLHVAVANGDAAMVDAIVACGAALDVPLSNGKSPLHLAAMGAHTQIVRALLVAGARANLSDREGKFTPLMLAAAYTRDAEAVGLLIDAGANVDARDKTGMAAVDYALASKNAAAVSKLKASGATTSKVQRRKPER
jgi:uncharacterized protein